MNMLRHVLGVLGMTSEVVRHEDYVAGCLDGFDLVIVGPGPGDPRDDADPKMARLREAVAALLASGQPFLAVCLGHQALCHQLGIPLAYKDIVFQGTQSPVVDRRADRAGRLLQHVRGAGRLRRRCPPAYASMPTPSRGDIHLLVGPHYRGIQFHAESILTEHGYDVLHDLVSGLLLRPVTSAPGRGRGRPPRLLHVEPGAPGRLRDRRAADRRAARRGVAGRGAGALARRALARAGAPGRPGRLRGRARGAARGDPAGARGLPRDAGPGDDVRRHRRPGRPRRTAWSRGSATTGPVSSPGCRS